MPQNYLVLRRRCPNCGYESEQSAFSPQCSGCHKEVCSYCSKYGYCSTCWDKLTPEGKDLAIKEWKKGVKKSFKMVFAIIPFIFIVYVLPIILFRNNERIFYTWLIAGTVILVISSIGYASHLRKKAGYKGVTEELRDSYRTMPKMGDKDKKILKLVLGCFGTLILLVIIIGISIISDF